ncbi:hypothetical protein GE061_012802 [Apolygus lucorum]|uniref:Cathepsin propeptide inhibitor domain-containing protein n=1 Tax=Apolygus lucorum TaxID=248454 RepID=A0A6A4KC59_APOLU|nr:hypothetical protein GE061_012802 [Apolygus lucorum]
MRNCVVLLLLGYVVYSETSVIEYAPKVLSTFRRVYQTAQNLYSGKSSRLFNKEFENFMARNKRHYKSQAEEKQRYFLWLVNYLEQLLTDPTRTEKVIDNEYDMTPEERKQEIFRKFGKRDGFK